jgi:site-specific DNA-methyltransferase (adenine-specific)
VLARKPLDGTVANNVLTHGVGGINIDGCRVGEGTGESKTVQYPDIRGNNYNNASGTVEYTVTSQDRFPANFIHDGSDEVLQLFPSVKADESAARFFYCAKASKKDRNEGLDDMPLQRRAGLVGADRDGELDDVSERWRTQPAANHHPTVKPTDLMRYLCRLVTPPNGTVLDPFTGSGSTGKAATLEGFNFIGIEQSAEYAEIANARINHAKENK